MCKNCSHFPKLGAMKLGQRHAEALVEPRTDFIAKSIYWWLYCFYMCWVELVRRVNDEEYVVGRFKESSFEGSLILEFKTSVKMVLTSGIWKFVERELAKKNVEVKTELSAEEFKVTVIIPPELNRPNKVREIREIKSCITWGFMSFMQVMREEIEGVESSFEAPTVIKKEPKSEW